MTTFIQETTRTLKHWWLFLLAGLTMIIASIMVIQTPQESFSALAILFSIVVFANGSASIIFSIANRKLIEGWGWIFAGGILDVIIGTMLISDQSLSQAVLPMYLGFWFIFRGIHVGATSLDLKKIGFSNWGWVMFLGISIAVLGGMMVFNPMFGVWNVLYLAFVSLMTLGITNTVLAFRLRTLKINTIDKIEDFKKDLKERFEILKSEILSSMKESSEESKSEVDQKFDEFESNV